MKQLLYALIASTVFLAPAIGHPRDNAAGVVHGWYRQYLNREPEAGAIDNWADHLRQGESPQWILSSFLGCDEYYEKAGSTAEGYVRTIFRDLYNREPNGREFTYWADRVASGEELSDVAYGIMARNQQRQVIPAPRERERGERERGERERGERERGERERAGYRR